VPFVDVLNTMLDDTLPLTPGEWPEWGNPITDKAAFDLIRSYSPYDNVKAQAYPPMLITGGLNDPRVTYWEPAKWAAKLRATKTDDNLLLLKINMGAGHGGKSGRWDQRYSPPISSCSALGSRTRPSSVWWFSSSGTRMRGLASAVLLSVWAKRTLPSAPR
jgi:oligopeptidase B